MDTPKSQYKRVEIATAVSETRKSRARQQSDTSTSEYPNVLGNGSYGLWDS